MKWVDQMYEHHADTALSYHPCRYGKSKLLFRGPKRALKGAYCAMLGGTETYGKFLERPYPMLVEEKTGLPVVNLGCVNAGVDVFASDAEVLNLCTRARVTVVQVMGAHNMSNRFYAVHPRRNDRFLRASALMKAIYREVDFTEFNFTKHMLGALRTLSPERFETVLDELRAAWCARMTTLADRIDGKTVLMWLSDRAPTQRESSGSLDHEPLFVDAEMLDRVRPLFTDYIEVVASPAARSTGVDGMIFPPMEEPAAAEIPGPAVHEEVATMLAPVVERLMR